MPAALGAVLLVALIFTGWELVEHEWFAAAGPRTLYRLHVARGVSSALLVAAWVMVIVWRTHRRYERDLESVVDERTRELAAAETKYRDLVEQIPAVVYATAIEEPGRILYMSPQIESLLGFPLARWQSEPALWKACLHAGDRTRVLNEFGTLRRTAQPMTCEYRLLARDGRSVWVRDEARLLADGSCIQGILSDITERKRHEEDRARLAEILDATPDLVGIADPQACVLYLNRAGRRLIGLGPDEELARMTIADRHPEWARKLVLETAVPAALRDGVWTGETAFVDAKGREVPFSQVILAHKSPEGELVFLSTIGRELSEQKSMEAQLRQAQKMEAIGQLAGGVAHDFNNLLGVIGGYADLLLKDIGHEHRERGHVEQILKATERAAALTRQLLAFSRKQVLQPRLLDLNTVLANIEKMLRRLIGEHVQLVTVFKDDLWHTMADPGQIEQVIVNLAVNARDAMPAGGKLILETANVELDEAYAGSHADARPGPHVMLAVSDTGQGIDSETLAHIFEPFFTTKEQGKGTGLGLSTVYGIVRQSGGHVNVYSEPGRGSSFKMYLPRAEGEADVAAPVPLPAPATGGTETILLAEDEASLRAMIQEILEQAGYTVLGAVRPDEALAVARSRTGAVHLLLTDVVMPGMSGRELAGQVQAVQPGARVLYMSGYANEAINHHGAPQAGAGFVQKPFTSDSLLRKVRDALDAPGKSP